MFAVYSFVFIRFVIFIIRRAVDNISVISVSATVFVNTVGVCISRIFRAVSVSILKLL